MCREQGDPALPPHPTRPIGGAAPVAETGAPLLDGVGADRGLRTTRRRGSGTGPKACQNFGSVCSQGSYSSDGPEQPPHSARPGPRRRGLATIPRLRARAERTNLRGPAVLSCAGRSRCPSPWPRRAPARLTSTARSPWVAIAAAIPAPPAPPPEPHTHGPATLDWAAPLPSTVTGAGPRAQRHAGRDHRPHNPRACPVARWLGAACPQPSAHRRGSKRAACKNAQKSEDVEVSSLLKINTFLLEVRSLYRSRRVPFHNGCTASETRGEGIVPSPHQPLGGWKMGMILQGRESFQQPQFLLQAQLSTSYLLLLMPVLQKECFLGHLGTAPETHYYLHFILMPQGRNSYYCPTV